MDSSRKRLLLFVSIGAGVLILLGILLAVIFTNNYQNSFGKGIPINNFTAVIRNIPNEYKEEIEATLYTVVVENSSNKDIGFVRDAFIRDGSYEEEGTVENTIRSGSFLVDIESLRQTYRVQFTYSGDETNVNNRGNATNVSCPEQDELRFGDFECTSFIGREAAPNASIIQSLPYRSVGFNVFAIEEEGAALILYAELNIPTSILGAGIDPRREAVAAYKSDVINWLASKGISAEDYTVIYNYNDDGVFIGRP